MRFYLWTAENVEHCVQHDVTPADFEAAFESGEDVVNSREHDARIGYDARGRLLRVIYEDIYDDPGLILPVTAFEAEEHA